MSSPAAGGDDTGSSRANRYPPAQLEINGEKSKFIFDDNRYTIKMTSMVNIVFFPKGFILKVNWTNKIFIKLINTITIRVA